MGFQHYLTEIHEANLNMNEDQVFALSTLASKYALSLALESLDEKELEKERNRLARRVSLIERLSDVGDRADGMEARSPVNTASMGVIENPDDRFGWYDSILTVASESTKSREAAGYFCLFHAYHWLAALAGGERRLPLHKETRDGILVVAHGLCTRASQTMHSQHRWLALKLRSKTHRIQGQYDKAYRSLATALDSLHPRLMSPPAKNPGSSWWTELAQVGQVLNDWGRVWEAELRDLDWVKTDGTEPIELYTKRILDAVASRSDGCGEAECSAWVGAFVKQTAIETGEEYQRLVSGGSTNWTRDCDPGIASHLKALAGAAAAYRVAASIVEKDTEPGEWALQVNDSHGGSINGELWGDFHTQLTPKLRLLHVPVHNRGRVLAAMAAIQTRLGQKAEGGEYEDNAFEMFRRALTIEPLYAPARENYALLLVRRKHYDQAARHLEHLDSIYLGHRNKRRGFMHFGMAEVLVKQHFGDEDILAYLTQPKVVDGTSHNMLTILKRWNSFTPSLPQNRESLGGGYLLSIQGQGIAVDPGFNFLDNLTSAGMTMMDIDHLVITHIHSDHWNDLENIILLRFELGHRSPGDSSRYPVLQIHACPQVALRIEQRLSSMQYNAKVSEVYEIVGSKTEGEIIVPRLDGMNIRWTRAVHCLDVRETSPTYVASGFILEYSMGGCRTARIGFTGDTAFDEAVAQEYKGVDLLVMHLGKVYVADVEALDAPEFVWSRGRESWAQDRQEANHLGLSGALAMLARFSQEEGPKLVVLSEFGEELGVHRITVANHLQRAAMRRNLDSVIVAGDVGQCYYLPDERYPGGPGKPDGRAGGNQPGLASFQFHCDACGHGRKRPITSINQTIGTDVGGIDRIKNSCYLHKAMAAS
ncbi:MAG: MBL fold metallo-hydrolase [Thermoleophilia bacterium]